MAFGAVKHEIEIVPLGPDNRFKSLVRCKGCHWQSHKHKEEDAEAAGLQHQKNHGYTAEPKPQPQEQEKEEEKNPTPVNTPPAQPTVVTLGGTQFKMAQPDPKK